ncbi:MAG: hypothetical protein FGF51_08200 [Candidatus Brockarchaeota archaeon]|nr:hypothetical protein [Candidatus Brockarchaeota archaeon]
MTGPLVRNHPHFVYSNEGRYFTGSFQAPPPSFLRPSSQYSSTLDASPQIFETTVKLLLDSRSSKV